jgi:hypothetical protein
MKKDIFWDMAPCRLVGVYRRFEAANYYIFRAEELAKHNVLLAACGFLGVYFDLVNRGNSFLRNIGKLLSGYTVSWDTFHFD